MPKTALPPQWNKKNRDVKHAPRPELLAAPNRRGIMFVSGRQRELVQAVIEPRGMEDWHREEQTDTTADPRVPSSLLFVLFLLFSDSLVFISELLFFISASIPFVLYFTNLRGHMFG